MLSKLLGPFSRSSWFGWIFDPHSPRCGVIDHGACGQPVNTYIILYKDPIGDPVRVYACYFHAREHYRRKSGCTSY